MSSSTQNIGGENLRQPDPFGSARVEDTVIITGRDAAAGEGPKKEEPEKPPQKESE